MTQLLLDTQLFVWAVMDSPRLGREARELMLEANRIYVSAVSIWEIAIKARLGKITAEPQQMLLAIADSGFSELAISARHAAGVEKLALHHRDPFDRLLIAQALAEPMPLLTSDPIMEKYSGLVVRV
jgi:PIN domain nuclease of toxin-antitoxin system